MNGLQAQQFDALGDATRRLLLERLRRGPLPVVDLAANLTISRPAVSQHLRILKDARLVSVRSVGVRRIYEIDRRGLESLRSYFEDFWDEALQAFKARVEEED